MNFGVAFSEFVQQGFLILFWLSLISLENFHKWISFRYDFVNKVKQQWNVHYLSWQFVTLLKLGLCDF